MAENTDISIAQQGHPSTRILGEKDRTDYRPQNQNRKKTKLLQSALQSRSSNQSAGKENRSASGKDRRTKPPRQRPPTKQDQQPTRTPGEQNRSQSLEDNQTGEKVQQAAPEKNQRCNKPVSEENRSDSGKETSVQTPQSTEKGQSSDAVSTRKESGSDWLRKQGENARKRGSNKKKEKTQSESTEENILTSEPDTLSFKWVGKTSSYIETKADPHERIIDALKKSDHFIEHYKKSSYLNIFSNNLNARINPSVLCCFLGKDETLDLLQLPIGKNKKMPPETPAYPKRSDGLFFKVNKNGKTEGEAPRIILHFNKQKPYNNTALAVFGYSGETIEDALKNDKRFKDMNVLYLKGTKKKQYECTVTLPSLEDDTYTIYVPNKSKGLRKPKDTGSHEEGTESNPIVPTTPPSADPGDFTSTEAYKKMAERNINIFNVYVDKNKDLNKTWGIIKEDYSNNVKNALLNARTMRMLTRPLNSVAMIWFTEGGKTHQGTCMVLTGNLFLTCCHVVKSLLNKPGDCKAHIIFDYESEDKNEDLGNSDYEFSIKILASSEENDYAIFSVATFSPNEGLLQYVALPPECGTVGIIGHPGGQCKQIDLCSVINFYDRSEVIERTMNGVHVLSFPKFSEINDRRKVTYNTHLYNGASGAPVFNGHGELVAMHQAGSSVPAPLRKFHVIEYGRSMVDIVIDGAVKIPELRRAFKEIVKKNRSLHDYIMGSHPVPMQPIIRELKRSWEVETNPEFNDNGSGNSPMDTSV